MATKKDIQKKKTTKKKRSVNPKFLLLGKIFLFITIITAQAVLAYKVVDWNYEDIYRSMNEKSPDDYGVYELESIVVNPADTYGKRYLMVEISLELSDKDHISLLEANNMKLKQELMDALSKRTVDQLVDTSLRPEIRDELSDIINEIIEVPSVRNLYFTKYVMQ